MHNKILNALKQEMTVEQAENAAITYTVNWSGMLDADTIATSTWIAENGGTVANEANTTTEASARLSGSPSKYLFTNKVTLASGDTMERSITLIVRDNQKGAISDYCS